jgi:hypothetical protein
MPQQQVRSDEVSSLLESEFQRSSDPTFQARTMLSAYQHLPGLRGLWGPATMVNASGINVTEMAGNSFPMAPTSVNANMRVAGQHAWYYCNGTWYWSVADNAQWDVTMTETFISHKGISLGLVYYPTRVQPYADYEGVFTKMTDTGNQRSYMLYREPNNASMTFLLSSDGVAVAFWRHTKAFITSRFHFVAATYTPAAYGNEPIGCRFWLNDDMRYFALPTSGANPAQIFNSTAPLKIGSGIFAGVEKYMQGYWSMAWLCGNYLPESTVWNLYESMKYVFGYYNEKGTSW